MNAQNDTQREADEILINMTADYRAGNITLAQWVEITRMPLRDGFLAEWQLPNGDDAILETSFNSRHKT